MSTIRDFSISLDSDKSENSENSDKSSEDKTKRKQKIKNESIKEMHSIQVKSLKYSVILLVIILIIYIWIGRKIETKKAIERKVIMQKEEDTIRKKGEVTSEDAAKILGI